MTGEAQMACVLMETSSVCPDRAGSDFALVSLSSLHARSAFCLLTVMCKKKTCRIAAFKKILGCSIVVYFILINERPCKMHIDKGRWPRLKLIQENASPNLPHSCCAATQRPIVQTLRPQSCRRAAKRCLYTWYALDCPPGVLVFRGQGPGLRVQVFFSL